MAASGYQVIYARNKQFKNGESILVGGSNKAATYYAPYSGTYYVHLRPYKNLNGKKYYGSWSNTKTVKVNIRKQAYHTETVWAKRGKNRIYGQVYVPDGSPTWRTVSTYGRSRTAGRIHSERQFLKPLQLLDQNDPNRTTTGLCTKDVRQLQHTNAHVLIRILCSHFLERI